MILGFFDYALIGFLILFNITFWRLKISGKLGLLVGILLFALILPIISQIVEINLVVMKTEVIDSYEFLYTFLRYPVYWIIGFVQLFVVAKKEL